MLTLETSDGKTVKVSVVLTDREKDHSWQEDSERHKSGKLREK